MLLLSIRGWGQTNIYANDVDGNHYINSSTIWSDPIYYVHSDIIINPNCTLTISPGVRLEFVSWYSIDLNINSVNYLDTIWSKRSIKVRGSLLANGTSSSKITFTKYPSTIEWHGIIFDGNENISGNNNAFYLSNNPYSEISNCIIEFVKKSTPYGSPNTCSYGYNWDGAIYLANFNNILIENCIFRYNHAYMRGGGIFLIGTNYPTSPPTQPQSLKSNYPIIRNNYFHNNSAKRGGAICFFGSLIDYPLVENNEIMNNLALFSGGGIAIFSGSSANISSNTIINNTALCLASQSTPRLTGGGGVVIGLESSALINGNQIIDNTAIFNQNATLDETGLGGGLLIRINSNVTLSNNVFYGNHAHKGGGVALLGDKPLLNGQSSVLYAENNQIFDNISTEFGGGIYIGPKNYLEFNRNILSNNNSQVGGGIYVRNNNDQNIYTYSFFLNEIFNNNANIGAGVAIVHIDEDQPNIYYANIDLINNLIHSNIANNYAAGVYFNSNINLNFNNNTVTKNYSLASGNGNQGDAVFEETPNPLSNNISFVNNLIYFNGTDPTDCQINFGNFNSSDFSFNNIMNLSCQSDPGNNFDLNPDFVDFDNNIFRLSSYSQLKDLGDINVNPIEAVDLDLNDRLHHVSIDIGAYEIQPNSFPKLSKTDSIPETNASVFPNPSQSNVNIYFRQSVTPNSVYIYDSFNKLILTQTDINNNHIQIDISTFPCGVYILEIISINFIQTIKFVKQ